MLAVERERGGGGGYYNPGKTKALYGDIMDVHYVVMCTYWATEEERYHDHLYQ